MGTQRQALELHHHQVGNHAEVARVDGQQRVAHFQRGSADQEIDERNGNAAALLLSVESSSQQCRFFRIGVHINIIQQFADEGLTPIAGLCRLRAVNATSSVRPTADSTARWSPVAATICLSIAVTVSPRRSAAMTTLESRISPMWAGSTAHGGC